MIDLGQVLIRIVERTAEGKLKWSQAVESNAFVTSVDAISIMIRDRGGAYRLDIFDESGVNIESLTVRDTTEEQDQQLDKLYALARRSALDVDSTLEKLAKALEL